MIYIDNRQTKLQVTEELNCLLERVIEFTLNEEGIKIDCEVSVILVDNKEIRKLNNEFRNIDRETDVLSFPMLDYPQNKVFKEVYSDYEFDESYMDEGALVLGDVVLSLEKVKEQSLEYDHSFEREAGYLTVHSILHLLGYDHLDEEQKVFMRSREEHILDKLDIKRYLS
jgi:probable rRNA maturation factor